MNRALMCVFLLLALPCDAAPFSVNVTLDSIDQIPGDGLCANALGQCSLRAAIMESNALAGADTIELPAGTYTLSLAGTSDDAGLSGDLDVADDLVISGAGASATVIDGGALDRVLDLRPSPKRAVSIAGVTLQNGRLQAPLPIAEGGAGMRVGIDVQVMLEDVVLADNRVSGVFGAVGIDNSGCIQGSGVRVLGNADVQAVGSANAASGGITTTGKQSCLVLEDSEISNNRGDLSGAIYVTGGASVTLRRTLIANNEARFSGAIEINFGGNVVLENVTISGNAGNPGAMLNDGFTMVFLINSTVTGNHGSNSTAVVGGIQDVHGGFGLTFLSNTILAGNGPGFSADDCSNAQSLGGGNILGNTAGCVFSALPSDQLNTDPGLDPLAENGGNTRTHLPGPNAIDRGKLTPCLAVDQRGISRPIDGDGNGSSSCDIGAVEFDPDSIFADGFDGA